MRLDLYLTEHGLAKSRERAKAMIKAGCVSIDGRVCEKPSSEVSDNAAVSVDDSGFSYVGRGLIKLETAFQAFSLDITNMVCADIGASTGGFTQCMLRRGARLVYAVDVGHGQLDESLANDPRVVNMEGVNARSLTSQSFGEQPEFISVDLSFISLTLVIPALAGCLKNSGSMAVLIKPQFEAGKSALNKKGIVRDKKDHIRVLQGMISLFESCGLTVTGIAPSAIRGGDGNREYLACLEKRDEVRTAMIDVKRLVETAFEKSE